MRSILTAAGMAIVALAGGAGADAAVVVDVDSYQAVTPYSGVAAGSSYASGTLTINALYQTFTTTKAGQLASVDLYSNGYTSTGAGDVIVSLYRGGSNTAVGTQFLGSATKTLASVANFALYSFDFTALGVTQAAGDTFTVKIATTSCGSTPDCTLVFTDYNKSKIGVDNIVYAGGAYAGQNGSGPITFSASNDLNFRTTVLLAPVPEPASWMSMIAGFGIAGCALRRRRVAVAAG